MKGQSKKKAVIISYIATTLNYVVLFLLTPLIIKMLGKGEYGLYNVANSAIGYLALLSLGLGSAYVRFYFRAKTEKYSYKIENLNGMYFLSYLFIAIMVVIFGTTLIIFSESLIYGSKVELEQQVIGKILLGILTFNLATTFIFSIFWSYTRAIEHFITLEVAHLIKIILGPMVTIPLLLLGFGSIGFVAGTTAVTTIIEISVMLYAVKKGKIKFRFNVFDKQLLKEILAYSLLVFGFQLFNQINNGVDNLVLIRIGGEELVSVYAVGATIAGVVLSLPNGITSVIIPEINKISSSDENKIEKIDELQIRYGRIIFMILILILLGFTLLGIPFLKLWTPKGVYSGDELKAIYFIVILLVLPKTFGYSLAVSSEYIKAENRHRTRLTAFGISVLLNIAVSIPLAIQIGPVGAAVGTAVTYTMYTIFMHFYYSYKMGINLNRYWLQILKMTLIYLIIFAPFYVATFFLPMDNIFIFLGIGSSFTLLFLSINYFLVMNDYEREIIKILLRLKRKPHSTT